MQNHILGKIPHLPERSRLDIELVRERAFALSRFGRDLEGALHELAEFDALHPRSAASPISDRQTRAALLADAARALWTLIVQREACGLYDTQTLLEEYQVPGEVQRALAAGRDPPCAIG
jgi:hypothetical protein